MKITQSATIELPDALTALDLAAWLEGLPAGVQIKTNIIHQIADRPWESDKFFARLEAHWVHDTDTGKHEPLK